LRARWVQHDRSMELPQGTKTIVATWWPGVCYLVSTLGTEAEPQRRYVTEVFRCYKDRFPKSLDYYYCRSEYEDLEQANLGTLPLCRRLLLGQLKLKLMCFQAHDHLQDTLHLLVHAHRLDHSTRRWSSDIPSDSSGRRSSKNSECETGARLMLTKRHALHSASNSTQIFPIWPIGMAACHCDGRH